MIVSYRAFAIKTNNPLVERSTTAHACMLSFSSAAVNRVLHYLLAVFCTYRQHLHIPQMQPHKANEPETIPIHISATWACVLPAGSSQMESSKPQHKLVAVASCGNKGGWVREAAGQRAEGFPRTGSCIIVCLEGEN